MPHLYLHEANPRTQLSFLGRLTGVTANNQKITFMQQSLFKSDRHEKDGIDEGVAAPLGMTESYLVNGTQKLYIVLAVYTMDILWFHFSDNY